MSAEVSLTVHAVIVPPMQNGVAYAHSDSGACVSFSGDRAAMMSLCEQVRAFNADCRGPVTVLSGQWSGVTELCPADCHGHMTHAA